MADDESDGESFELPNGLRIVVLHLPEYEVAAVSYWLNGELLLVVDEAEGDA